MQVLLKMDHPARADDVYRIRGFKDSWVQVAGMEGFSSLTVFHLNPGIPDPLNPVNSQRR